MKSVLFFFCFVIINNNVCSQDCTVFINEMNIDDCKEVEINDFIELKSTCANYPLRGYKLLGIDSQNSQIELVATLWNNRTDANGYFVIGGRGVENAGLKVPWASLKYRTGYRKKPGKLFTMNDFLVNGNKHIKGIVLIYKRNDPFSRLQLVYPNTLWIQINNEIFEIIKETIVDMIVFGKRAPQQQCNIFQKLVPPFVNKKYYVLREYDKTEDQNYLCDNKDRSINRCTDLIDGFLPEKFKLGKVSPGQDNDCTRAHFVLEDHVDTCTKRLQQTEYVMDIDESPADDDDDMNFCSTAMGENLYQRVDENLIHKTIDSVMQESSTNVCSSASINPEAENLSDELSRANKRKRHADDVVDYSEELEWETEKYFE